MSLRRVREQGRLYSPNCRQGGFSETAIHPLGCLCVTTGGEGRIVLRRTISSRHLVTRLDRYTVQFAPGEESLAPQEGRAAGDKRPPCLITLFYSGLAPERVTRM